jgi:hypothetical protein
MKTAERPFRTFQQFNKCAKAWALLTVYHNADVDGATADFCQASFNYVERELLRMKLPDGWNQHAEYRDFVQWFTNNT